MRPLFLAYLMLEYTASSLLSNPELESGDSEESPTVERLDNVYDAMDCLWVKITPVERESFVRFEEAEDQRLKVN